MKIKGKEYKINVDVKWKYAKNFSNITENNHEELEKAIKRILIPQPTDEEIDEFGTFTLMKVIMLFSKAMQEKIEEFKKKLSL